MTHSTRPMQEKPTHRRRAGRMASTSWEVATGDNGSARHVAAAGGGNCGARHRSGHLIGCGFRSARRPGGAGIGVFRCRIGQLGPDFVPVIGPQIAAGDGAFGGAFNRHAALNRHRPDTRRPLPHQLRLGPNLAGKRSRHAPLCHVVFEFHGHSISDALKQLQAPRSFRMLSDTLVIKP